MIRPLANLHAIMASLLVAVVVMQAFLAGLNLSLHAGFGYTVVGLVSLSLVISAALARVPRVDIALAMGALVLYFVQAVLPALRGSMPAAATLHPANAFLLFAVATWAARRALYLTRSAEPQLT